MHIWAMQFGRNLGKQIRLFNEQLQRRLVIAKLILNGAKRILTITRLSVKKCNHILIMWSFVYVQYLGAIVLAAIGIQLNTMWHQLGLRRHLYLDTLDYTIQRLKLYKICLICFLLVLLIEGMHNVSTFQSFSGKSILYSKQNYTLLSPWTPMSLERCNAI